MKEDERREARILIVEDILVQLEGNARDIEALFKSAPETLGVDSCRIDKARDVVQSEHFLANAAMVPYDVAVIDLSIPLHIDEDTENIENGQRLLERIRAGGLAKEIIVTSIWFYINEVARAYQNGVFDFIQKPFETTELQARFMRCWKQLMSRESTRLLGESRMDELVQYTQKGLAHRFTNCFSNLVQAVAHKNDAVERYLRERYDLDRQKDSQDPLFQLLRSHDEVISKSQNDWAELRDSLISPDDSLRAENVELLLGDIRRSILPALVVKNVGLDLPSDKNWKISTFADDVGAVLKEILVGGVRTVPDYGERRQQIDVSLERLDEQVRIIFSDQLEPIASEDAAMINSGKSISASRRFDRAWGLSVVQRVAVRGGGRLEIAPRENGNVVTYYVPSAES